MPAKKPAYLGALNAIANGERGGHELFAAWSAATSDDALRPTLDMVAVREMEHSFAFEKRLNELGFSLQTNPNKDLKKLVRFMKSGASDEEKFEALGVSTAPAKSPEKSEGTSDGLLALLADKSIDPQTGALLGRFICEERDSGRELTKAYRALQRRGGKRKAA